MDEYLPHPEYENTKKKKHPDSQDELAGALKEDAEIMKNDLSYLTKLAQYYYDNK
jgi:hypothetical protein